MTKVISIPHLQHETKAELHTSDVEVLAFIWIPLSFEGIATNRDWTPAADLACILLKRRSNPRIRFSMKTSSSCFQEYVVSSDVSAGAMDYRCVSNWIKSIRSWYTWNTSLKKAVVKESLTFLRSISQDCAPMIHCSMSTASVKVSTRRVSVTSETDRSKLQAPWAMTMQWIYRHIRFKRFNHSSILVVAGPSIFGDRFIDERVDMVAYIPRPGNQRAKRMRISLKVWSTKLVRENTKQRLNDICSRKSLVTERRETFVEGHCGKKISKDRHLLRGSLYTLITKIQASSGAKYKLH